MKKNVVIFVPIYKKEITEAEQKSLHQLLKILFGYQIYFVHPKGLDLSVYKSILNNYQNIAYKFHAFNPTFFESILGYNHLLTSLDLYRLFKRFDYFLVYQLDAFVFKDELQYWTEQGIDYIGAPWFESYHLASPSDKMTGVGNGGFCLRNAKKAYQILRNIKNCNACFNFLSIFVKYRLLKEDQRIRLSKFLCAIPQGNQSDSVFEEISLQINEDIFWAVMIPQLFDYKIASIPQAIKFSFEANPSHLFELNNKQLPFGCHAWERYEPEFWQPLILS